MPVRLAVEVLAADGAEPGAVRLAEDLVGQREHHRVAPPPREIELVVCDVGRLELLVSVRILGLILASVDGLVERRVLEAAVAGAVKLRGETEAEDGAVRRPRHRQLGGH